MPDDIKVGINVTAEGDAVAKQVAADVAALRQNLTQLYNLVNANFRSSSARRAATDQEAAAERRAAAAVTEHAAAEKVLTQESTATGFSLNALTARVLELAAAFAGFQAFKAFVTEGIEFNKTIETANLGIASLITSQTRMTEGNGQLVTGVDKLRVAQELATDQVQKLRVAGLQTTATTQELVVAFQQAVGIGLRWGLTLDQIRVLTIQMSQAAGALGLPMNQLNEEIRDLLGGNINPRNTRIATALGITNEQIRTAQNAGQLFDFVTKRLDAFTVAGEATAKTFSGVMSNIREAFQNFAGDATKPLFDTLKSVGQSALEDVFDLKRARISDKFNGILETAHDTFGVMGDLLADAINAGLAGTQGLSEWMTQNRGELTRILQVVKDIGIELGLIVGDVLGLANSFAQVGTETGFIRTTLAGVGYVLAAIREGFQYLVGAAALLGTIVLHVIVGALAEANIIVGKLVGLFNEDLGRAFKKVGEDGMSFLADLRKGLADYNKDLANGGGAIDEYVARLQKGQEVAEKLAAAQERRSDALQAARDEEFRQLQELDAALAKHTLTQKDYAVAANAAQLSFVQKQIAAQKQYFNMLDATDDKERRRTVDLIQELQRRESALKRGVTLTSTAPLTQKDSAAKTEQGEVIRIKAELAELLSALKRSFDEQKLSIRSYYAERIKLQQDAVDQEIAALRKLQATQTDKGAAGKTEDQIKALQSKRLQIVTDELDAEHKAYTTLDAEVMQAHVELLRDQGRLTEAAALETQNKFKKLIAQLKEEVKAGTRPQADLNIVNQLFDIDTAKTNLEELQRRARTVQQTLGTQLAKISADEEAHAITTQEARSRSVVAYQQAQDALKGMADQMERFAQQTEDPNAIDSVEQLRIKIEQMGTTIKRLGDDWASVKDAARSSATSSIAGFIEGLPTLFAQNTTQIDSLKEHLTLAHNELDQLMRGPKTTESQDRMSQLRTEIQRTSAELDNAKQALTTWRDLFLDAARSIVQALQRVAAEMLATAIIQRASGFLSGAGFSSGGAVGTLSGHPAASGSVNAASGGYIRGAGTATSDSIPAWLSNGEYVIQARAVRALGVDLLNTINAQGSVAPRSRSRGRGYADGGLVQAGQSPGGGFDARVGLEDGLVVKHMQTKAGTRVILDAIANNPKTVRSVLGGR